MRRTAVLMSLCLLGLAGSGCRLRDRGLAKLQVVEDLTLGAHMEDIKQQWFLYSTKPLVVDTTMSTEKDIVYRGVSRDPAVTVMYFFFNSRTKILHQVEWRYHSSMTAFKEKELLEYWTKKLWPPDLHHRWEGRVYVWKDRNAELDLYLADGICHLIQKLN
jgi:hypothetical protein